MNLLVYVTTAQASLADVRSFLPAGYETTMQYMSSCSREDGLLVPHHVYMVVYDSWVADGGDVPEINVTVRFQSAGG